MIMEKDKASLRVWSVRGTLMITSNCFSQWTLKTKDCTLVHITCASYIFFQQMYTKSVVVYFLNVDFCQFEYRHFLGTKLIMKDR